MCLSGIGEVITSSPPSKPFPLPYAEDFHSYKAGTTPKHLCDMGGALEVINYPGKHVCNNRCYNRELTGTQHRKRMLLGFQNTMAGSNNVDAAHGPMDMVSPLIFNIGVGKKGNLMIQLKTVDGRVLETKQFKNLQLEEGRTKLEISPFQFVSKIEGNFAVEYVVSETKNKQ